MKTILTLLLLTLAVFIMSINDFGFKTLSLDELIVEQTRLQHQYEWFHRAELSFRDPAEAKRRLECEDKLAEINREIRQRQKEAQND